MLNMSFSETPVYNAMSDPNSSNHGKEDKNSHPVTPIFNPIYRPVTPLRVSKFYHIQANADLPRHDDDSDPNAEHLKAISSSKKSRISSSSSKNNLKNLPVFTPQIKSEGSVPQRHRSSSFDPNDPNELIV